MSIQEAENPRKHTQSQASILARQAIDKQEKYGKVTVLCPKCHTHPVVRVTPRGERITVRCKCGYVASGEIYF